VREDDRRTITDPRVRFWFGVAAVVGFVLCMAMAALSGAVHGRAVGAAVLIGCAGGGVAVVCVVGLLSHVDDP